VQYQIHFDADGIVTVRTSGSLSVEGVRAYLDELVSHPRWRPGTPVLVDHRALDVREISAEEIRTIADDVARMAARIAGSRNATLVSGPLAYGLARMWETLTQHRVDSTLRVFDDPVAARAWLLQSG
jgi:hypothetical protein